ncbi:hypothetical protein SAMN05421823_11965 [Catalinimonas alkaloidigena]|uniref:Uncharacterized protein n=1 Tax=Catalinimonas alkaloidigena TaxID=1075417 RepID=A0A1G9VAV8_9BACT|nr:hypothetical protein [Catalinimonas alkaloidigena]SDM68995.1 hypothetical protein SAMN05421823_11965 [Catalinimonas alkaloidigena]
MKNLINPTQSVPSTASTAAAWIEWHKALRARYGKPTANQLFLEAWQKRQKAGFLGLNDANTVELRDYLKKEGITLENGALDFTEDLMDTVEGWLSFGSNLGKFLTLAVVVVLLLLLVPLALQIGRNPKLILDAAKTFRPGL